MKVVKLDSPRAAEALDTIRYTKKPDVFISASVTVGQEQARKFKETLNLSGKEGFPVFYKLRDSRYGILGFRKEFPNVSYYPVTTYRYGENYSNVNVELSQKVQIAGEELMGFYDPMVSRGTTTVNTICAICDEEQVETLSSFHFFVAEPGINKLDLELRKFFYKEYIIVLGMRGFEVDTSGYMGAILREQDYGDVMEGTYWKEYPPEVEQALVENGIRYGANLEVIMAYILHIFLKHKWARYSDSQAVPQSLKELPTYNWINAVLYHLQQMGAKIPISDWKMMHLRTGLLTPTSLTVSEVLRQMQREWLIDEEKEIRSGIEYKVYHITPWGDSYLKKVYLPVLGRNNMLSGFTPILEEAMPRIVIRKFRKLLDEINLNQKGEQSPDAIDKSSF